jgi:hypothetical protein
MQALMGRHPRGSQVLFLDWPTQNIHETGMGTLRLHEGQQKDSVSAIRKPLCSVTPVLSRKLSEPVQTQIHFGPRARWRHAFGDRINLLHFRGYEPYRFDRS